MRILLVFVVLFCSISVFGQKWKWAYPITSYGGTPGGNYVYSIKTDSSNNAYFAGELLSTNNKFEGRNDTFPVKNLKTFVVKYTPSGNIKWIGGGWMSAYIGNKGGFSLDKAGNTYLTGSFYKSSYFGNGTDTLQRISTQEAGRDYLVKLDSDGKALYFKVQGDTCLAEGLIVNVLTTNNLIYFGHKLTACPKWSGTSLAYLKKLDASSGKELWSIIPNEYLIYDGKTQIISTQDNGFLISSRYNGDSARFEGLTTHKTLQSSNGATLAFIVKYSSKGEVEWAKKFTDTRIEFNNGVAVDEENNIFFAVESQGIASYDHVPLQTIGNRTLHLIKLDALGNYIRHLSFNSGSYLHFGVTDLKSDRYGNVYVGAKMDTTLIIGKDTVFYNTNPLKSIFAIMKFDSNLNYLWSQYVNGYTNGGGVFTVTDSIIYVAMNYDGDVSLHGTNYYFPRKNTDWSSFLAAMTNDNPKTAATTGVQIQIAEAGKYNISIYPNPSNGVFTIVQTGDHITVNVLNVYGQQIFLPQKDIFHIDLTSQPKGIYFIQVDTGKEKVNKKVVLN
jgi:hypothetical protein